jgi:Tfp pilus assembly protein PilO
LVVLLPSFRALNPLKEEVKTKRTLENQLNSKLSKLRYMVDSKAVVEENAMLIERILPGEARVPQLLTQIDIVAKESGFQVTKMNYSFSEAAKNPTSPASTAGGAAKPIDADPYKKVDVSLGVEGNYDQLITFLKNLEDSARMINVSNFRYTSVKEAENNTGVLDISLALSAPYITISSKAITDDPINLNLADQSFISRLNQMKSIKYYDISIEQAQVFESTVSIEQPSEDEEVPQEESVFTQSDTGTEEPLGNTSEE